MWNQQKKYRYIHPSSGSLKTELWATLSTALIKQKDYKKQYVGINFLNALEHSKHRNV